MRVRVGTSGYSYRAWKPSFYPEDVPASGFLRYYASRFETVEINATFYRLPSEAMLAKWPAQVPEGFVFALKAPQLITHRHRLVDAEAPTRRFYEAIGALGAMRGPVLFQLPPWLPRDVPRLEAFLDSLPDGGRAAIELRHPSWFVDATYEALRARGAALCVADTDERATPFEATAGFGYLRLRRRDYSTEALRAFRRRILEQPWSEAYVFFKHEEEGRGPRLARALNELLASATSRAETRLPPPPPKE
jgi:uncharacterized protein YecE (DUF72 family)